MCELYRQEFLAELGISKLYSYHKKPKEEKLSLNSAIRSYERLKDIYKVEENKNSDLKKKFFLSREIFWRKRMILLWRSIV